MPVCKICKGTEFERDLSNANNDLVCKNCGVVSEDNPIVSEVTFGETSSGAAMVQGSFISAGQAHASFMSHGGSSALESREATLNNARRKLRAVSHALNIPDYITDAAFQWYKLSLANNFVQGRRSQNVIAACLYVACRKEKTHHMLIDFSSRLQVSVYSIGATFLKMVKRLHIVNLPLADPSLFIQHFAEKLDLGDKKIKVTKDAVKLAQRMSDEWMFEGRRPAGIAGACVLLACRMNNLRRTHSEIVAVSHVAEETLQERLNEFKQTKAGKLSVKEFREEDNTTKDQNSRPPSFMKNRKNEKRIKEQIRQNEIYETSEEALNKDPILSQVLSAQELSSKEVLFYLKQFSNKRKCDFQRMKATHGIDDEDLHKEKNDEAEEKVKATEEEKITDGKDKTKKEEPSEPKIPLRRSRRLTKKKFIEIIEYNIDDENYESDSDSDNDKGHEKEESEDDNEELEKVNGRTKGNVKFQDAIDGYSLEKDPYRPQNLHLLPKTEEYLTKVTDDPDNLSDVDDEEIESVILDEEASKLKERIWIGINEEYLIEQENKRLKEEADLVAGNTANKRRKTGPRRKRIKTEGIDPQVVAQLGITDTMATDRTSLQEALRVAEAKGDFTTADSVKTMLQRASFSKKINYDAIDGLFN
ncbi:transcription factor IIIB 70 kDa subunit [Monosporozyma unispora]